jgi:uncharacterized membrane protein YGL010W
MVTRFAIHNEKAGKGTLMYIVQFVGHGKEDADLKWWDAD